MKSFFKKVLAKLVKHGLHELEKEVKRRQDRGESTHDIPTTVARPE